MRGAEEERKGKLLRMKIFFLSPRLRLFPAFFPPSTNNYLLCRDGWGEEDAQSVVAPALVRFKKIESQSFVSYESERRKTAGSAR